MTPTLRTLLCAGAAATLLHAAAARAADVTVTQGAKGSFSGALGIAPPPAAAPTPSFSGKFGIAPDAPTPPEHSATVTLPPTKATPTPPAAPPSTVAATPAPTPATPTTTAPTTTVTGAPVTPAQGAAAEAALRIWIAGLLGPSVTIANSPVKLTPAGDHFDVVIPILPGYQPGTSLSVTATAQPIEGGKWNVNNIKFTTPVRYTLNLPVPPKDGATGPATTDPVTFTLNTTGQDGSMVLDPSFASPTTLTTTQTGATIHAEGAIIQDTTIGPLNTVATISPAGPGRVDITSDGTMQAYHLTSQAKDSPPVEVGIKLVRISSSMAGLSQDKASIVIRNMTAIVTTALAAATPAAGAATGAPLPPPKITPEVAQTLLDALQDIASGMTIQESLENISVDVGGMAGALEKFGIGLDAKSVDGILQAHMDLGAQGLTLPDLPLGGMETLIPQSITLRPFVSGIGVPELRRMVSAASVDHDPAPADIQAMFSHGGITSGLESMSLVLGGATFTGNGKIVATSPDPNAISGTAQITAEHFDDLMQKITAMPALAQAIPVLVFAKGIGHTVNDKIVWDISYKNNKILVNNVDLSAMAAGPPAATPAPTPEGPAKHPTPPRPAPARPKP